MRFQVNFLQLTSLVRAYHQFSILVPKRWYLISQFVTKSTLEQETEQCLQRLNVPTFCVGVGSNEVNFDQTPDHCRRVCRGLEVHHPDLLNFAERQAQILFTDSTASAFKPIVLLPPRGTCCGKSLFIRYMQPIVL